MKEKPKILLLDIETSYLDFVGFSRYPNFIPEKYIIKDWHIICASWKWLDQKQVHSKKTYTDNDKQIVKALGKAIMEADVIVYHNGRKFDWKKLNTRNLKHRLPPLYKPKEFDTLLQCKKHFGFTSNRLDYVCKYLGLRGKLEKTEDLWLLARDRNKKAIDKMAKYCNRDVLILEELYLTIRPYTDNVFNMNILSKGLKVCSECGHKSLHKDGIRTTKKGIYQRYRCNKCGKCSTSSEKINKEKVILGG